MFALAGYRMQWVRVLRVAADGCSWERWGRWGGALVFHVSFCVASFWALKPLDTRRKAQ